MMITMVATICCLHFHLMLLIRKSSKTKVAEVCLFRKLLLDPHLRFAICSKKTNLFFWCHFRLIIPFCRPHPRFPHRGKRKIESFSHTDGDIIVRI